MPKVSLKSFTNESTLMLVTKVSPCRSPNVPMLVHEMSPKNKGHGHLYSCNWGNQVKTKQPWSFFSLGRHILISTNFCRTEWFHRAKFNFFNFGWLLNIWTKVLTQYLHKSNNSISAWECLSKVKSREHFSPTWFSWAVYPQIILLHDHLA